MTNMRTETLRAPTDGYITVLVDSGSCLRGGEYSWNDWLDHLIIVHVAIVAALAGADVDDWRLCGDGGLGIYEGPPVICALIEAAVRDQCRTCAVYRVGCEDRQEAD